MLPIKAIPPNPRTDASPYIGVRVDRNPAPLLWPASKRKNVRYSVRLSQSDRFPKKGTITEVGLPWAMYTPSRTLETGIWYWQVGETTRRGKQVWSERYSFEVTARSRKILRPHADQLLSRTSVDRPRLVPARKDVRRLQAKVSHPLAQRLYEQTAHLIGQPLPNDRTPPKKGDDEYKRMKFARWGSKGLARKEVGAIEGLLCAWLLNGEDRFVAEAIRRAVNVASWDPDGFTNPIISDFADASSVRAMALVYDAAHSRLTGRERGQIRDALVARCSRFFDASFNNVETLLFGGHLWQHLLTEFFEGAFALLGEVPEARLWCRYIYELWVARFPLIAGDDGGWANGPSYFGTNVETLILMPHYFARLGAEKFDDIPWFRNVSNFLPVVWPPGSFSDGFGDGTELHHQPNGRHLHFMEYLGSRFADPAAKTYAGEWRQHLEKPGDAGPRLALLDLINKVPPSRARKVRPRPKTRLFHNKGLVVTHTNLGNISKNLMVAFRSSPFGSFNHMHACQNAFNIFYGGQRLFANSGYYIAATDEHAKQWYKSTRGHNTLLIDGQGQTNGPEGFGWIPRFIDGESISYTLGDASNAYGGSGLVRYRRHIAVLHPHIVVVYDDLEADHAAVWTWQLHAHNKMTYATRSATFKTRNAAISGHVTQFASTTRDVDLSDVFDPPATNWSQRPYLGTIHDPFPKRWHAQTKRLPPAEHDSYRSSRWASDRPQSKRFPMDARLSGAGRSMRV